MKRLILFIACCFSLSAFAANPSFQSFNVNQFDVTGNRVSIKDSANLTNIVLFGSSSNLLEVWNSDNVLKFYIDTNGFSHPDLWTSDSGTITGNSTVADGASAVGFSLNSSNSLANTTAKIATLSNNGTNKVTVDGRGGIVSEWTIFAKETMGAVNDPLNITQGFYASVGGFAEVIRPGYNVFIVLNATNDWFPDAGIAITLDGGSTFPLALRPEIGATATPYTLGTSQTHSSGNLVEVANNTTNRFVVDYLGNVTAAGLTIGTAPAATYAGITNVMTWALSDMTTALTTGTNKNYWYAPAAGMTIKFVRATLAAASSSGTPTFDINEAGTSILSTKITIDANEWDSFTAATPPVISDAAIAANAKVDFDIDVAGTAAAGSQIQVGFTVP